MVGGRDEGEDGDEDQTPYEKVDAAVNEMHESVLMACLKGQGTPTLTTLSASR